jgi:hypothetical protein
MRAKFAPAIAAPRKGVAGQVELLGLMLLNYENRSDQIQVSVSKQIGGSVAHQNSA